MLITITVPHTDSTSAFRIIKTVGQGRAVAWSTNNIVAECHGIYHAGVCSSSPRVITHAKLNLGISSGGCGAQKTGRAVSGVFNALLIAAVPLKILQHQTRLKNESDGAIRTIKKGGYLKPFR